MNIRSLARLLLVAALSAVSLPLHAQSSSKFTAGEQGQVSNMAMSVERLCSTQVVAKLKEQAVKLKDGTIPEWVSKLTSGNYCSCIAQRIRTTATPAMIRQGTEADGRQFIQNAANECAVENFKATFPEVCLAWIDK